MPLLLSIIIPTRNRDQTLVHTLASIRNDAFSQCEILVSNNDSSDRTQSVIDAAAKKDPRIRCIKTPQCLSMSRHWEFALSQANGEYVTFLGDDDAVMPGGLQKAVSLLQAADWPDALASVNAEYHWPSSPVRNHANIFSYPTGRNCGWCDCEALKREVISGHALYNELPMIYKGWIKYSLLSKLQNVTGSFFKSCQPDIYMAVACSILLNGFYLTEEPLFIEGISCFSNGAQSMHRSVTSDKQFFLQDSIPFHPSVPFCPASAFLVLESVMQCRDAGLDVTSYPVDYSVILKCAVKQAAHMDRERYLQCIDAARSLAKKTSLSGYVEQLISDNIHEPQNVSPFAPVPSWVGLKWNKYPVLSLRADLAGCTNIADVANIAKGKLEHEEDSILKVFSRIATDPRNISLADKWKIDRDNDRQLSLQMTSVNIVTRLRCVLGQIRKAVVKCLIAARATTSTSSVSRLL